MNDSGGKKKANEFVRSYGISGKGGLYDKARKAATDAGYTVIEYGDLCEDEDARIVAESLGIREACEKTRGFTYVDSRNRLVFINNGLTEAERTYVLLHELGHILLCHSISAPIFGRDVSEEHEANEFVHYVLHPSIPLRALLFCSRHKAAACGAIAVLAAIFLFIWRYSAHREEPYIGEYYATDSGTRYHLKGCFYIKGRKTHRLTKEEFESGKYEPCSVCIPLE